MVARFFIPLFLLAAPSLLTAAIPQDLTTHATPLGHLARGLSQGTGIFSPDNSRLAFPAHADDLTPAERKNFSEELIDGATAKGLAPIRLYIDGVPTPASSEMSSPVFSSDSQHVGYAMRVRDKWHVIMDGKPLVTDADAINDNPIIFSPDSHHVATVVQKSYRWYLTVDGKPWPAVAATYLGLASFSPDAKHVVAIARTKNTAIVYLDGVSLAPLFDVAKPLERIFPSYIWKPDSTAIGFYGAFPQKHWQLFTTDIPPFESAQYDAILRDSPIFSPDSSRLAFGARSRGQWTVLTNADVSPLFDEIAPQTLTFLAPDPKKAPGLLYIARIKNLWQLYINHHPIDPTLSFDKLFDGTFLISPDRRHYAFAVVRGDQLLIIRDGKPSATAEAIGLNTFAFSPDSQHLAYAVRIANRWHVAIDGRPGTADFASIAPNPIAFSPDSQTVAYAAQLNAGVTRLYVGANADYQSQFFDNLLPNAGITWRDPTHLVTISITKFVAHRLEATIPAR